MQSRFRELRWTAQRIEKLEALQATALRPTSWMKRSMRMNRIAWSRRVTDGTCLPGGQAAEGGSS